jgi:hypothetical protein
MNDTQTQLMKLIRCSINEEQIDIRELQNVNWNKLLKYANDHQVKELVYLAIHKINNICMDKDIFEQLKKDTLLTAVWQIKHINQVAFILNKLNENKIPMIALKGLVIRELYPRPEFRTMSDADILVKKSDLVAIKSLMESLGYTQIEKTPIHVTFGKSGYNNIEVHWTIAEKLSFQHQGDLEKDMWNSAINVMVGSSKTLSFSDEDLVIHLCVHMVEHILVGSFGIRQLCDLLLIINKRGCAINWESFFKKGQKWGIEKFIIIIFLTCKQLFQVNIPREIEMHIGHDNDKLVIQLIDDILSGGVYGSRDVANAVANEFARGSYGKQGGSAFGVLGRFLGLIFPSPGKIKERYNYASKYKVLMPIAWLHNIIVSITQAKYRFIDKIRVFSIAIFISFKRRRLLKKLELIN